MNWNGQRRWLDHLIAKRSNPANAENLQAELNKYRRNRVNDALTTRPVLIPLVYNMTAAGSVAPYTATTPSLGYEVIITGFKTDTPLRDIVVRRTESEKPICYVGDETDLLLRVDDLAGSAATNGGGQLGTFYLPSPISLPAGNRLSIEMFKTDTTADPEQANIVLIGVRVFSAAYKNEVIDRVESDRIEKWIAMREIPQTIFLKQLVEFDTSAAGGEARNLFTPSVAEPLLIRGLRTTLRFSQIELNVQGEPSWTVAPTPIWGVAGEDELVHDNYIWFSKPIFLPAKETIEIRRIINSIDGILIDPQTDNTLTWIVETV